MKSTYRKWFFIFLGLMVIISVIEIITDFFTSKITLLMSPENSLVFSLKVYPEDYSVICADGISPLLLEIALYDTNQNPVPYSMLQVDLRNFSGSVKPARPVTGKNGKALVSIIPDSIQEPEGGFQVKQPREIPVSIELHTVKSKPVQWHGILACPPVLLVHGFQDTSESMVPLKEFLQDNGFHVYAIDYATDSDMETMSGELNQSIHNLISDMKSKGIHTETVDIVSHSLGGLVTRYYTSSEAFLADQTVRKAIFVNVPHHGTPWAEAGAKLLDSPFLAELYPTSSLYTVTFPNSINKGLNHNLQVANIALENDEVVPLPSSMLSSWNIGTKIYRIGSEPLDLESVIHNQMSGGSRHRQILFYIPVFEEILHYLTEELSYPQKMQ